MGDPFPDCAATPRVYTVPAGTPFARTFTAGLRNRLLPLPPDFIARTQVYVSGRDQISILQRSFRRCFATGFLPSAHSIRNVETDLSIALPTPPGVSRRHRLLVLCRFVSLFLKQQGDPAGGSEVVRLASRLGALLDELHAEGVDAAALLTAAPAELASHWESASRFLALIGETWPVYLQTLGLEDPARCRALAVDAIIREWEARPPSHPVLVAGSTATDATSRRFAAAVTRLPLGAVVLPGLDQSLDDEAWNSIADPAEPAPGHPQYSMRRLLDLLGIDRGDVRPWSDTASPRPARTRFLGQALRPAPVTEAWRRDAGAFDDIALDAMRGVELIEAASADEEAAAIALVLREAAATSGIRAVLVTEDNELRQRVVAKCERWAFRPVDRRGTSLAATPYGRFAVQTAQVALGVPDLAALFGLLKDPHYSAGRQRDSHLYLSRRAEQIVRERSAQLPGIAGVRDAVRRWSEKGEARAAFAAELDRWRSAMDADLQPLACFAGRDFAPFQDLLHAHLQVLDRLERSPRSTPSRVPVRLELDALWDEAKAMGDVAPAEYADIVSELLVQTQAGFVQLGGHPRIAVEGNLSARFDPPDLVVLGGLNEDTVPGDRGEDPWLNRAMRAGLGLPPPERAIGTMAHDAAELFSAERVVLTRAARTAGETRVASRWLLRLVNLLEGTGSGGKSALHGMQERGNTRLAIARSLERPAGPPEPASRPAPRPPVPARPRRLSATQIERLLKDPYSIYAERILNLRPLEPLGATPDALLRGIFLHQVLAQYLREESGTPTNAAGLRSRLETALAAELERLAGESWLQRWPWHADLWKASLEVIVRWLVEVDSARFASGWRPAALEASGRLALDAPFGPVEIVARADRIDTGIGDAGPACRIYDYKTGRPPSVKDIGAYRWEQPEADGQGWAWQLGISTLIAQEGGFEGLDPLRVDGAEYIGFRGVEPGEGECVDAFALHSNPESGLADLREALEALVGAYDDPDTPYTAWAMPEARSKRWPAPFDHLSRLAEWTASGADEEAEDDG